MLPHSLLKEIEKKLSHQLNRALVVRHHQSVGGGCINNANRLETTVGFYFLKWNNAHAYPGMFEAEAKGLKLLRSAGAIFIPEVIATGEAENKSFILLEFIEAGRRIKNFWEDFGAKLASLHKNSSDAFGLDHDNYIGSLPQSNKKHSGWADFFIHERLEKQIVLAKNSGAIGNSEVQQFHNLEKHIYEIIPEEKPALLHGDLWNGNYMIANDGTACLIDPAVYYGHREMDLAMTKLFGGFAVEFYQAYNERYPIQKGFELRADIHNLYPLLVHVNLFGGGYVQQVKAVLSKF
jgi:fructosamine-3-kinase